MLKSRIHVSLSVDFLQIVLYDTDKQNRTESHAPAIFRIFFINPVIHGAACRDCFVSMGAGSQKACTEIENKM